MQVALLRERARPGAGFRAFAENPDTRKYSKSSRFPAAAFAGREGAPSNTRTGVLPDRATLA